MIGEQGGSSGRIVDRDRRFVEQQVNPVSPRRASTWPRVGLKNNSSHVRRISVGSQERSTAEASRVRASPPTSLMSIAKNSGSPRTARADVEPHAAAADHQRPVLRAGAELRQPVGERLQERLHQGDIEILGPRGSGKIGEVK